MNKEKVSKLHDNENEGERVIERYVQMKKMCVYFNKTIINTYAYQNSHQLKLCDQLNVLVTYPVPNVRFATVPTTLHYENI